MKKLHFLIFPILAAAALFFARHQPAHEAEVLGAHTGRKIIYLTLDADMSQSMKQRLADRAVKAWYDPALFAYLERNNIPASFFVSGLFAETYPDLIRELTATGLYNFENHAYDESGFTAPCYRLKILKTDEEKIEQIQKTQAILENLTGRTPVYFRFPGICHGARDDALVRSLGLVNNDGDIVASDPFNNDAGKIIRRIYLQAHDGGALIMHVGGPNAPKSLEVLKQIIPGLERRGYVFEHL